MSLTVETGSAVGWRDVFELRCQFATTEVTVDYINILVEDSSSCSDSQLSIDSDFEDDGNYTFSYSSDSDFTETVSWLDVYERSSGSTCVPEDCELVSHCSISEYYLSWYDREANNTNCETDYDCRGFRSCVSGQCSGDSGCNIPIT